MNIQSLFPPIMLAIARPLPSVVVLHQTHLLKPNKFSANQTQIQRTVKIFAGNDEGGAHENQSWVEGLKDPLLSKLETQHRKFHSAMTPVELVRVARTKHMLDLLRVNPLWIKFNREAFLDHEHKNQMDKLLNDYINARKPQHMRGEDLLEVLKKTCLALYESKNGRFYSEVVEEWVFEYLTDASSILITVYS